MTTTDIHVQAVPQDGYHLIECSKCGPLVAIRTTTEADGHPVERFCARHLKMHRVNVPAEYEQFLDG